MNERAPYTLNALLTAVRDQLKRSFSTRMWVVAEIGSMNIASTGHCYIELLERDSSSKMLIAKCSATIWKGAFSAIHRQFRTATGYDLGVGMKVLAYVEVTYHQVYGMSLNISDIDPSFTVGEIEMRRREIIAKLTKDGDIDRNSMVDMPQIMQRIAVVSSDRAAGYEDFCKELQGNEYGYAYKVTLFKAVVQGDGAEESIVSALKSVYIQHQQFDVVVIIRGGGSKSDLACFDSYAIAKMVAYSPLPVVSGIGHERDESIVDMCAAIPLKTPTAVARYLIDYSLECDSQLTELKEYLHQMVEDELLQCNKSLSGAMRTIELEVKSAIREQSVSFASYEQTLKSVSENIIYRKDQRLTTDLDRLTNITRTVVAAENSEVDRAFEQIKIRSLAAIAAQESLLKLQSTQSESFDPKRIFALGYSFTKVKGRALRSTRDVTLGETIDITLYNGSLEAKIIDIKNGKKTDNIR